MTSFDVVSRVCCLRLVESCHRIIVIERCAGRGLANVSVLNSSIQRKDVRVGGLYALYSKVQNLNHSLSMLLDTDRSSQLSSIDILPQ